MRVLALLFAIGVAVGLNCTAIAAETLRVADEKMSTEPIGVAWMEPDGTLVVDLRRTADGINISMPPVKYPRSDPRYADILKHLGPLRPGETVLVKPWPDDRPTRDRK